MSVSAQSRGFWAVYLSLSALSLAPLLLTAHAPSVDGAAHLAMVKTWSQIDTPGTLAHTEYIKNVGQFPYLTYYGALRLLGEVMPLPLANRLVLGLYALALPASFLLLLRAFGRSRWLVLLVFPLVHNGLVIWGWIANALALPIFVVTVALLQSHLSRRSWRVELLLALSLVLLYLTHLLGALAFAVAGPVLLLSQVRKPRLVLRKGLFALPALALALTWSAGVSRGSGWAFKGVFLSIPENLSLVLEWTVDVLRSAVDETCLFTSLATLLLLLAASGKPRRGVGRWPLLLTSLAVIGAYFLLPAGVHQPMIHFGTNARLLLPGLLLLLATPTVELRAWRLLILAPALVGGIVLQVQVARAYARYGADLRDLRQVIVELRPNRRFLGLMSGRPAIFDPLLQRAVWRHSPLLYQAVKGGYTPRGFGHQTMPARWRQRTPHTQEDGAVGFSYQRHGRFYDYVISVHPPGQPAPEQLLGAVEHFALVKRAGRFAAFAPLDPSRRSQ